MVEKNKYEFSVSSSKSIAFNARDLEIFKMNLIAVSHLRQLFFVASKNQIVCYKIYMNYEIDSRFEPIKIVVSNNENEDCTLNQILLKSYQDREYLMCVGMDAKVSVYDVDHFDKPLYQFDNKYSHTDDNSTWSLDMFIDETRWIICCGSNAWRISYWKLHENAEAPERKTIEAHNHNVPCVKFSPCGNFVASTSIDGNVKVFMIDQNSSISEFKYSAWVWAVTWIEKSLLQQGCADMIQNNKPNKTELLKEYLLVVALANKIYLMDPFPKESQGFSIPFLLPKGSPKSMTCLDTKEFLVPRPYSNHSRVSLMKTIPGQPLILGMAQHSPIFKVYRVGPSLRKSGGFNLEEIAGTLASQQINEHFSIGVEATFFENKQFETMGKISILTLFKDGFLRKTELEQGGGIKCPQRQLVDKSIDSNNHPISFFANSFI